MPESASVGSAVGRIRAHDLDAGSNAEVDYAIVPGDEGNMFDIISNGQRQEGVVLLKKVHTLTISCKHKLITADIHQKELPIDVCKLHCSSLICIIIHWVIYSQKVARSQIIETQGRGWDYWKTKVQIQNIWNEAWSTMGGREVPKKPKWGVRG